MFSLVELLGAGAYLLSAQIVFSTLWKLFGLD